MFNRLMSVYCTLQEDWMSKKKRNVLSGYAFENNLHTLKNNQYNNKSEKDSNKRHTTKSEQFNSSSSISHSAAGCSRRWELTPGSELG